MKKLIIFLLFVSFNLYAKDSLKPCPDKPNCVNSMADKKDEHFIKPLPYHDLVLDKVRAYIEKQDRWNIIEEEDEYIHATSKSAIFGFVDDVEFLLIDQTLHVRSSSRTGYYDFSVNRKRIERIREYLKD